MYIEVLSIIIMLSDFWVKLPFSVDFNLVLYFTKKREMIWTIQEVVYADR